MVKKFASFLGFARFHTTLRLHQKATKIAWYKRWHDFRFAHHFHVAMLVLYVVSVLAGSLGLGTNPNGAYAASGSWSQTTFAGTGDGTYASTTPANSAGDIAIDGVSLSNPGGGNWKYKKPITVTNSSGGALTDYQVQVSPFTDSAFLNNTGLVGSWHLNGGTSGAITNGTVAGFADSSGNTNNGSVSNTNGTGMAWAAGKFDGSVSFDGVDDKVSLPFIPTTGTSSFSIFSWVKTSVSGTRRGIINYGADTSNQALWLYINASNQVAFDLANTAGPTSTTTVNDGQWHFVGVVNNAGSVQIYVDGAASGSAVAMSPNIVSGAVTAAIGGPTGANASSPWYFNGQLDEICVFNRVLTSTEISLRYGTAGVPKVRADYKDIRFVRSDGTELSYWQENDGKFWVKYGGSLPTGSSTIYMYYGNPSAVSSSNGTNTFTFFDDFNGTAINATKWVENDAKNAIYENYGLGLSNVSTVWDSALISNVTFTRSAGLTLSGSFTASSGVATPNHMMVGWENNQTTLTDYAQLAHGLYFNAGSLANIYEGGTAYTTAGGTYAANSTTVFRQRLKTTGADYLLGNSAIYTGTGSNYTTSPLRIGIHEYAHIGRFNYIFVHQNVSADPTATVGVEATITPTAGTFTTLAMPTVVAHQGKVYAWGNLAFSNTLNAQTITYDVLDSATGNTIAGYTGITTSPTSLAGISTTAYPALKIRANLSGSGTATPLLNDLSLAYSYDVAAPTVPAGVTVSAVTSSSATLSWTASTDTESGLAGYEVMRAPDSAGVPGTWVAAAGTCANLVTATNCTDSSLSPNTKYWYRVRAKDNVANYSSYTGGLQATGGTVTYTDSSGLNPRTGTPYVGGYVVQTFTTSGTLSVTVPGNAEALVVAGGGGGASGGGGAGGLLTSSAISLSGNMSVTVGAGGAAGCTNNPCSVGAYAGGNSVLGNLTAMGGGAGGGVNNQISSTGANNGGSGGGAGYSAGALTGGTGTAGQGYAGGSNIASGSYPTGGGGGAGGVGANAVSTTVSGAGGVGVSSSITGTATMYAAGGGGGIQSGTAGLGGSGIGGNGSAVGNGTAGAVNTGSGGGGGKNFNAYYGGNGGSGIVVIRYPYSELPVSTTTLSNAPVLNNPTPSTNDNRPQISNSSTPDTTFANSQVRLYNGATEIARTTASGTGAFTFGDNKLTNPSFETDTTPADGVADGWTMSYTTATAPTYSLSTDSRTGAKSQRVQYTSTADPATRATTFVQRSASGAFTAGDTVKYSVWLKGTATGCNVVYYLYAYNAAGTYLGGSELNALASSSLANWTQFTRDLVVPAGTDNIRVGFYVTAIETGDSFDIYADDSKLDNYSQVLADGTYSLTAKVLNSVGVESAASNAVSVLVDTVLPVTAASTGAVSPAASGWYTTNPIISLTATDATPSSGSLATVYKWDDITLTSPTTYSTAIDMNASIGQGIHTLYFRSTDAAGNIEKVKSAQFKLDTVTPVADATSLVLGDGSTYTKVQTGLIDLHLSSTDATSGMNKVVISMDNLLYDQNSTFCAFAYSTLIPNWDLNTQNCGVNVGGDGSKTVYVKFTDIAGNITAETHKSVIFDITNPANTASVTAKSIPSAPTPDINTSTWTKYANPTFTWSGATDATSGLKDYYVYFGTDQNADPETTVDASNLFYSDNGNSNLTAQTAYTVTSTLTSGSTYYLKVLSRDNATNVATKTYTESQNLFIYKFDSTPPAAISYIKTTPAGYTTTDSFTFEWDQVADASSQLKEYKYMLEDGLNVWNTYGIVPDPITGKITLTNIHKYKDDVNIIEVKAVDNAGNETAVTKGYYYYAGSIPAPEGLTVDLSRSQNQSVNNFSFSWNKPATITPQGYYYSVNSLPSAQTATYVPYISASTSTGFAAFATRQGPNNFYVVTKANDTVGWTNYATTTFTCNTAAPGIPQNVLITDSSNRDSQRWQLTVNWDQPADVTPDFSGYIVERSTDGTNFTEVATTAKTTTGYLDTGLLNVVTYSYRIFAKDSTGNKSAASTVVSKIPTGKYTTPPNLVGSPKITIQATKATVTWTTDRSADSFVQVGTSTSYGMTQGQLDATTDHSVNLSGLVPGTSYHFRTMWRDIDGNIGYSTDKTFRTQDAPGISEVTVSDIRLDSAIISWKSTTISTSQVNYGKSNAYGLVTKDESASTVTVHVIKLDNLDHSSTYHFKISSVDADGNAISSDDYTFDTLKFPIVSNLKIEQLKNMPTSSIKVTWESNVPTTSVVNYSGRESAKSQLETKHTVIITGLHDNSSYTLSATGRDQYGTEAAALSESYKTDFDTRPPLITNVTTESSVVGFGAEAKTQVIISWETDEPGTSQIEYDFGTFGDNYQFKTQEDGGLTTSHVVIVSGLKPSTSYHFRTVSRDASKNTGYSDDNTILTEQASSSIIDIIVNSLQNSLGWLFGAYRRG